VSGDYERSFTSVCEVFTVALEVLVGPGPLRERLRNAFIGSFIMLHESELPPELWEEYRAIKEAVSWIPVEHPGQGTLDSTTREMSDEEARELARRIVLLFHAYVTHPETRGG
jgi:hypothetical protein